MTLRNGTSYLGSIVTSSAGRDSKRLFAIVKIDEETPESDIVYIADGRLRKVETPKKKKLKHLKFTNEHSAKILELIERKELTNNALNRILNEYRQV